MVKGRLKIEVAGLKPYEVILSTKINKVGRAIDNTVGLRDMNVSRYHFQIHIENEQFVLKDLGSRNGTMVNGKLVNEKVLEIGDRMVVGSSTLTFLGAVTKDNPPNPQQNPVTPLGPGLPTPKPSQAIEMLKTTGTMMSIPKDLTPFSNLQADIAAATANTDLPRVHPRPALPDRATNKLRPSRRIKSRPTPPEGVRAQERPKRESALFAPISEQALPPSNKPKRSTSLFADRNLFKSTKSDRDRWRRLAEVAEIIGTEHDLEVLLESMVDVLLQLVPSRGAFVVLIEDGDFKLKVARDVDPEQVDSGKGRYRLSTQICKKAAEMRRPILTDNASNDTGLNQFRSVTDLKIECVLCMPFGIREKVLGVVYLDAPQVMGFIGKEQEILELVGAFGNMTGVAVWNAQLLDGIRQQERIEQELRIATRIQQSLLPKSPPVIPGLELDGRSSAAKEIGGDLYDFLKRPAPFNDLLIGIGDVSGKGVGAGLVGSSMRSLLHAFSSVEKHTDKILIEANRILAADLEPGIFVSFVLIRVDLESGKIYYTGAGHEHLIIFRARTNSCEKHKAGGVVLGLSPDLTGRLEEKCLKLEKQDMVVLYTDGATEATNNDGEEFGINRIGQIVLSRGRRHPEEVVHAIFETVLRFHGRDKEQEDDLTIVAFRCV